MLLKMTEEPDDYEGPWPRGDAMTEWVMVPREPTAAMLRAAFRLDLSYMPTQESADRAAIYRAMLDAAPVQQTNPQCQQVLRKSGKAYPRTCQVCGLGPCRYADPRERSAPARREEMAAFAAELKADPAKAQKFFQEAGILNERGELMPQYGGPVQPAAPASFLDQVRENMAAMGDALGQMTEPAAPVQQAEPVAWRYTVYGDMVFTRSKLLAKHADDDGFDVEPLYLHPPPAEVQRLQSLVDRLDASNVRLRSAMHAVIEEYEEHRPLAAAIDAMRTTLLERPDDAEVQRLRDAARDVCEWADAAQWALGNETGVPAAKLDALRRALEGK